ncbi:MAG: protein translocase subunit SecD, partial [Lentisphaeria bacterium]
MKLKSVIYRLITIALIIGVWCYEFGKKDWKLNQGLDLQGGTEFIVTFNEKDIPSELGSSATEVRDQIVEILRNRIDPDGTKETEIKGVKNDTISVKMPAKESEHKDTVRKLIRQTAKLTFHAVHENNATLANEYSANPENFKAPLGYSVKFMRSERADVKGSPIIIKDREEPINGGNVKNASARIGDYGGYQITLEFNPEGARQFGRVTELFVNRPLAIVLDGSVYSAPNINEPIHGGSARITGRFSDEEAKMLATVLKSGNLPVSIKIDSEFNVDPSLGAASVKSGKTAAVAGLIAVIVFMIIYYMTSGIISALALSANILIILGTMAIFNATLTLPGIAGIVLTIGMAVDANVIIFERIREELNNGKSLANAIHAGYDRAFVTIFDANITTLLTAAILYNFGTGSIKGFAVTLSIGILASMFTALFMTRALFDLLLAKEWTNNLKMMQIPIFMNPKFNLLGAGRITSKISIVLVISALVVTMVKYKDAFSVDFSGGSEVSYTMKDNQNMTSEEIQNSVLVKINPKAKASFKVASEMDGTKTLSVIFPEEGKSDEELAGYSASTLAKLRESYPEASFNQVAVTTVGSAVGAEFKFNAIISLILAVICIILYISFRFEFKFAIAANIALVHDVLIAIGIFLLLGRQISLPVIAALLTIIGYSLNDTIVVFDRIREDLALMKGESYSHIINLSI